MKSIGILITILLLVPALSPAQDNQEKKVMVFPFKAVSKKGTASFNMPLAQAFARRLAGEGGVNLVPGHAFQAALKQKKTDFRRIARLARRDKADLVIWGVVTEQEKGSSLIISVIDMKKPTKPQSFTATGTGMEHIVARMENIADRIGGELLNRPVIGKINLEGNKRIRDQAIKNKLELMEGKPFRKSEIGKEIRSIYSLGYFDDVQIHAKDGGEGRVDLQIVLQELPSIKNIEVKGNSVFTTDKILDELTTKSFSFAKPQKIRADIAKIKRMYEKEGYYEPKIEYEIKELSGSEAELIFKIEEGEKSYLTKIVLDGRKHVDEDEIKKIMTIKEKSWTWFLDDTGKFTREDLELNRRRLIGYLHEKGYVTGKVGAPKMRIKDGSVTVTYPIHEGDRFQVRNTDVEGDLIMPEEKIIGVLDTKPGTWYKGSVLAEDTKKLTKLYQNMGYAYVDVEPLRNINDEHDFVDTTFKINKGRRITIEKVDIAGNDRTRDKIIRRSVLVGEGDLYRASSIEGTKQRLESMDFFEAVTVDTAPGSRPDLMNVKVQVMEKKTGSLAAGMGFSTQDGPVGNIDLKERNLFGLGITVSGKGNISGRKNTYEGSISYPWLLDMPLNGTLRGYNTTSKEPRYQRISSGFSAHLGFPVYGFWSLSTGFSRDTTKLGGIDRGFAGAVKEYYRRYNTDVLKFLNISENAISLALSRDTRVGGVIHTGGAKVSMGTRLSGFGGDVAFSKYFSEAVYYRPMFRKILFKVRANASLLAEVGEQPIPFDRRILLGGVHSIRGYQDREIGPRDKNGYAMGGDRGVFGNLECLFPLIQSQQIHGVAFVDAGNAWNASDSPLFDEVKAGAGLGIRWISPMGPIRIEYGWKINPRKGEAPGNFAFAMGQLF